MSTRLFRHSRAMFARERGGAERAEGARQSCREILARILYGSFTHQRVENQGAEILDIFVPPFSRE